MVCSPFQTRTSDRPFNSTISAISFPCLFLLLYSSSLCSYLTTAHFLRFSPWNYPLILTFQPLLGAIAAGCPAAIKPSEILPAFSVLLAELIPKYLDPAAYKVILGAVPEITKALELKCTSVYLYYLSSSTSRCFPPSVTLNSSSFLHSRRLHTSSPHPPASICF